MECHKLYYFILLIVRIKAIYDRLAHVIHMDGSIQNFLLDCEFFTILPFALCKKKIFFKTMNYSYFTTETRAKCQKLQVTSTKKGLIWTNLSYITLVRILGPLENFHLRFSPQSGVFYVFGCFSMRSLTFGHCFFNGKCANHSEKFPQLG